MGVEGVTNLAFHFFNKIEWSLKIFSLFLLGVEPWKIEEGPVFISSNSNRSAQKKTVFYIGLALEIKDMGTNIVVKYMRKKKNRFVDKQKHIYFF